MRMYDVIHKKREGFSLTDQEIAFFVQGYVKGEIPDYQVSALLMAIFFKGMDSRETAVLTREMAASGDQVDLSAIRGIKVDKHSTGGVGDKTTLVLAPLLAACGLKVAKMSGRGLGHTGGTLDKLEAVPGVTTTLAQEKMVRQVNDIGLCVAGQTGNLVPADKLIYALRDVTATVDSIPLIASSIMSKKLAAGSDVILLDVKVGSGAFMKSLSQARKLAQEMLEIGERNGRKMAAILTDMDQPLGRMVGNQLEVEEAMETLQGKGPKDLTTLCLTMGTLLLQLAEKCEPKEARKRMEQALYGGGGYTCLQAMLLAQGGHPDMVMHPEKWSRAMYNRKLYAPISGYITHMDTEGIGIGAALLGAGRETKQAVLDYRAGIQLLAKTGDYVEKGAPLAVLYAEKEEKLEASGNYLEKQYSFGSVAPPSLPLIYESLIGSLEEQ